MTLPDITLPIVHLNGTGQLELIQQRIGVHKALEAAYRTLKKMAPNGRDYYPAGPAAMEAAIEQHQRRMLVLDGLMNELEYEIHALDRIGG